MSGNSIVKNLKFLNYSLKPLFVGRSYQLCQKVLKINSYKIAKARLTTLESLN